MFRDEADGFKKESNVILKKSKYLETGISWHLKCCGNINNYFARLVDLRTVLLNHDVLKHLKPRLVYRLYSIVNTVWTILPEQNCTTIKHLHLLRIIAQMQIFMIF